MVNFIRGEDAIWHTDEYDVVLVGINIQNKLTNCFAGKLVTKYRGFYEFMDNEPYGDQRRYGTCVSYEGTPEICAMYVCGYRDKERICKNIESCLKYANVKYAGKKCMTTIVGTSMYDGKCDRDAVIDIIERTCTDIDLDVYDYEQMLKREEAAILFRKMLEYRYTDHDKFENLWYDRYDVVRRLYLEW